VDVFEAIKGRRSIRKYKAHDVSNADLEVLLEAARCAPSWANTQCWQLVIVRDGGTKAKLADTLNAGNPATEAVKEAPVVVVACAELGKSGFYKGEAATDKGDWFMFDVALALHNVTLAAHSLDLGTVHVGLFDAGKAAQIIGTPQNVAVVEILPVGYPEAIPKAPPRKELSEFVFYERHGSKRI